MEEFDNYVNDWELFEQFSDYEISYNDICNLLNKNIKLLIFYYV